MICSMFLLLTLHSTSIVDVSLGKGPPSLTVLLADKSSANQSPCFFVGAPQRKMYSLEEDHILLYAQLPRPYPSPTHAHLHRCPTPNPVLRAALDLAVSTRLP